jgi:hypothetical protein
MSASAFFLVLRELGEEGGRRRSSATLTQPSQHRQKSVTHIKCHAPTQVLGDFLG